ESPAFDLHHPQLAELDERKHTGKRDVLDAPGHESDR
ncbi:cytochrome c oxidase subunit I, partial [Streptomyces sp. 8P21H-1]|nr:cytochrome c oxidase subunit I [Streptomyces sp. 8P21H-1]